MTSDPIRLLDDPSAASGLQGDLLVATEAKVHGLDLAAGLAQLQAATGSTPATTATLSTGAKLGLGAAALTAGVVALWLGFGSPSSDDSSASTVAVPEVAAQTAKPTGSPATEAPTPPEEPPTEPAVSPEPPTDAAEADAASDSEPPPVELAEEPEPKATVSGNPRRATRSSKAAEPATDDSVLREARMVAKARSHLAKDPARALSLAEQAEQQFPQGQLVEERRAIAIRALVGLGRHDEAQRRADPFLARFGQGAHAAAVRRALKDAP